MPSSCSVDASVLMKWYLDEPFSAQARELREDFVAQAMEIVAPALMMDDVMRGLQKAAGDQTEQLRRAYESLGAYRFSLVPLSGDTFAEVLGLTTRKRMPLYDACYVAVAKVLGLRLWTADRLMVDKARDIIDVRHIKDYTTKNGGSTGEHDAD